MQLIRIIIYWALVCIALLNLITYFAMQDWNAVWMFVFVAAWVAAFDHSRLVGLAVALMASAVVHESFYEGMTVKKKKPKSDMYQLEGLAQNTSHLVKRQKNLFDLASKMEPMMKQVSDMMKNMPEGFMETAMENLKVKLKQDKKKNQSL
jgi:short-subunit dehydrogenase